MALRESQRQRNAKRMLLFFGSDQTTSILDTSKLIKILEGDRLVEGGLVLVKYGKEDLEARVLKLHDDPSILREAQDDFVLSQHILEDDSVDKENLPPAPKPKKQKMSSNAEKPNKKQSKPKKSKQLITIEAEESASKEEISPESTENLEAKNPGTMNFLNQQEQDKVRQLLAAYQEKEMRENGCQTESNICKCQEAVVQRLEKLEQNVEKILIFMERRHEEKVSVPENQGDELLFNSDPIYAFSNDSIEDFGHLPSLGEISSVLNIDETLPGMETSTIDSSKIATTSNQSPTTPTVQCSVPAGLLKPTSQSTPAIPCTQQSIPVGSSTLSTQPSVPIPANLFDEVFAKSSSMSNYAKNLVFSVFDKAELLNANCTGACNKNALEKDPRLGQIREMTFKKHSAVDNKIAWSACRKAIDAAIRKLRMQTK